MNIYLRYKHRPNAITLTLGDWDLKSTSDGPAVKATPAEIRVHPQYSRTTLQNDIAVIKVSNRIDYTRNIRPICLPSRGNYMLKNTLICAQS